MLFKQSQCILTDPERPIIGRSLFQISYFTYLLITYKEGINLTTETIPHIVSFLKYFAVFSLSIVDD